MPNYNYIQKALLAGSSVVLNSGLAAAASSSESSQEMSINKLALGVVLLGACVGVVGFASLKFSSFLENEESPKPVKENRSRGRSERQEEHDLQSAPRPENKKQRKKRLAAELAELEHKESFEARREKERQERFQQERARELEYRKMARELAYERQLKKAQELKQSLTTKTVESPVNPAEAEARARKQAKIQAWTENEQHKADMKYGRVFNAKKKKSGASESSAARFVRR